MATAVVNADVATRRWRLRLPERLPDLRGVWLKVYCVVWGIALLLAIVAPIRGLVDDYARAQRPTTRPCGLILDDSGGRITVLATLPGSAVSGKVHAGDELIEIDRQSVQGASLYEVVKRLPSEEGRQATLLLQDSSQKRHEAVIANRHSTSDRYLASTGISPQAYVIAQLLTLGLISLFLVPASILLFVRRRGEAIPSLLSLAFLGLVLSMFAGPDGLAAFHAPQLVPQVIGDFAWSAIFVCLATFPDGRFQPWWTRLTLLVLPLMLASDLVWPGSALVNITGMIAMAMTAASLWVRGRRLSGMKRQQLRWAVIGFLASVTLLCALLPLFIFDWQLMTWDSRWLVWKWTFVAPLSALAIALMPVGLMVSILRYRLYDADTVLGRSAAYGVLTLGFIALFAGAEKLAEIVGERYFEHSVGIAAGAIGAAVAAACIVPLHNRVHRWAERRFQKPLIRLREGLPDCLADLRDTASVAQIAEAVMKRVAAGVRSTREAVILVDGKKPVIAGANDVSAGAVEEWRKGWHPRPGEEPLDCQRKDALFQLRVRLCIETGDEPETIGWLLLGPRPDGSFFGKDEREALAHVAGAIARAIHIAQRREAREQRAESRLSAIEKLIARLAEGVGSGGARAAPA